MMAFILMATMAVVGWLIWLCNRKTEWKNVYLVQGLSKNEKAIAFFRKNQEKNENKRRHANDKFNLLVLANKLKPIESIVAAMVAMAILSVLYKSIIEKEQIVTRRKNVVMPFDNQKMIKNKLFDSENTNNKETKVIIINNSILVPVIIENKGIKIQIVMILDTGCSQTLIHYSALQQISPSIIGQTETLVADGRIMPNTLVKIDAIDVGPFRERNFIMTTTNVQNENMLQYNGLLGMAFLKKHPFQIDTQRQVIRRL